MLRLKGPRDLQIELIDVGETVVPELPDLQAVKVESRIVRLHAHQIRDRKPLSTEEIQAGGDSEGKVDRAADVELPVAVKTGPLELTPGDSLFGLTIAPEPMCCCQSLYAKLTRAIHPCENDLISWTSTPL